MANNKLGLLLFFVVALTPLSGCIEALGGCGAHYDEAYGGYDYVYSKKVVASDNSLNVTVQLLNGGGGWIENSDEFQEEQTIYVTLHIKLANGNEVQIKPNHQYWEVNGDSANQSYWGTNLYFSSRTGFCDNGCEEIRFSAGSDFGAIYYDGTCDSSPWIGI